MQHTDTSLNRPHIGIFDSGIGGLSVLRVVQQRLPWARLSYVADTRHTPWGDRPALWVQARSEQLTQWLIAQGASCVLVACNTATTQAITQLRARWPDVPFVGVEPGIKPAAALTRNGRVAVLATPGTLRSARTLHLLAEHGASTTVLPLPCPGLVEAIEGAQTSPERLTRQLDEVAARVRATEADTVVLGCTHYPLVAGLLAQRLPGLTLLDTAEAVARRLAQLTGDAAEPRDAAPALLQLFSTGEPAGLQRAADQWLDWPCTAQALSLPDPA